MADAKYLKEDDYLNVSEDTCNIIYHPSLNVILLFTKTGDVKVLDVNSGLILHSCSLHGKLVVLCCKNSWFNEIFTF